MSVHGKSGSEQASFYGMEYTEICISMDEYRQLNGWMEGGVEGWMVEGMERQMVRWPDGWMDGLFCDKAVVAIC